MRSSLAKSLFGSALIAGAAFGASPAAALNGGAPDPAGEGNAVMILNEGGGFCTALALDQRTLITAGHCLAGGRDLRIYWRGENGDPVIKGASAVSVHPNFVRDAVQRRQRSIDLGLVRLAEPLPSSFGSISLSSASRVDAGAPIIAQGYGPTSRNDPKSAGVMRRATLTAIEPYGPSNILLWAQSSTAGICPGDSGGAMFDAGGDLIAVIAWGGTAGSSGCGGPAQGVLVAPQRAWINRVLASWGAGANWR